MRPFNLAPIQWLQILILPLVFAAVGVIAKNLGRKDGDTSPHRNDWAVGTAVVLMTFGKVAADLLDLFSNQAPMDNKFAPEIFGWLLGMLLALFVFIMHDRFGSWDTKADKTKRLIVGVIAPDLVGLVIFGAYQARKVGVL